jgi:Ricin-type beta-trefoil lectin domain
MACSLLKKRSEVTVKHFPSCALLLSANVFMFACASSESTDEDVANSAVVTNASPITSGLTGKCLDDSKDATTNGNKIQLYTCNGTGAQKWAYVDHTFVGPGGKCLDINADHQVVGNVVQLYQCNGTAAQNWSVNGDTIRSTNGLCLDVRGEVDANGTQVQLDTCDGGAGEIWHVGQPEASSSPHVVQTAVHQSPTAPPPYTATAPFEGNSSVTFSSKTKAGDMLWVVATVSDYGGIHAISVTDSQHNTFVQLDQENDGQPGSQSVVHFYARDIAGDTQTPDVVTVNWGSDNYKGVLAVEITGTTTSPLVGHNGVIQDGLAAGTDKVESNTIAVNSAEVPALFVALSMSTDGGGSDTGGNGCAGPSAANGFASVDAIWNWSTDTLATFETDAVTVAGSPRAQFNSPCAGPYVTVAAVFH